MSARSPHRCDAIWASHETRPARHEFLTASDHRGHEPRGYSRGCCPTRLKEVEVLLPKADLLSRIAEHDIGFAGEMKYCRSRDLRSPTRFFTTCWQASQFVASDTVGQKEIAAQADGAVYLYPSGNSQAQAEQLNRLLASAELLGDSKAATLRASEQTFCWERQAPRLPASVEMALAN